MSVSLSRIVGLAVAVLLLGADATASARPKRHPAAQRPPAEVTTNCGGTPIIMQGMGCSATLRARSGTGNGADNGADRGAATQGRGAPPAHHARQRRSLRPLGSTHAVGRAVPAVGVGLHAAGDRQPQRADQGPQFIFPAERRPRAQSQQSRRLHPLQSQQVMAAAVSAGPVRPRLLMAPARHSGTTGSGLPPGRLPALGRVLMKSRLVTAPWINVRFGPLCDSSRTSPEVREAPLTDL